jgi:chromate reductase, NAD(P)H dehydrogenase (quinone)
MAGPTRILLISGSTRGGSSNSAALRTAQAVAPPDLAAVRYEGLELASLGVSGERGHCLQADVRESSQHPS